MKTRNLAIVMLLAALPFILVFSGASHAEEASSFEKKDINIDVNKEDREVGLKRLELIDKTLSQDLIDRKRRIVQKIEADYNNKATSILDSVIAPIFGNKVFTHIEVNYFSPQFTAQVETSQKVNISIILKRDGFDGWAKEHGSEQRGIEAIGQLIGSAIKVPVENISVVVVN